MEDAMALLQTGKRLACAAFRRESICWPDDSFSLATTINTSDISSDSAATTPPCNPASLFEFKNIHQLLSRIKFLICRRTAVIAALDAGLYSEAIRHFSKIVDGHRPTPQRYREIPGKLCSLTAKIQILKQRVASGEIASVDYYALIGLRRGCSRSELERAHLLMCLRHKPDKATKFIDRCQFPEERDLDSVRDSAKMSALLLYRLVQKGYSSVMSTIMDEEATEKRRKIAAGASQEMQATIQVPQTQNCNSKLVHEASVASTSSSDSSGSNCSHMNAFQGVFCRDLAAVGNLLSQVGFSRPLPMNYEALSC